MRKRCSTRQIREATRQVVGAVEGLQGRPATTCEKREAARLMRKPGECETILRERAERAKRR